MPGILLTDSFFNVVCTFLPSVVAVLWTTFFFLRAVPWNKTSNDNTTVRTLMGIYFIAKFLDRMFRMLWSMIYISCISKEMLYLGRLRYQVSTIGFWLHFISGPHLRKFWDPPLTLNKSICFKVYFNFRKMNDCQIDPDNS